MPTWTLQRGRLHTSCAITAESVALRLQKLLMAASWLSRLVIHLKNAPRAKLIPSVTGLRLLQAVTVLGMQSHSHRHGLGLTRAADSTRISVSVRPPCDAAETESRASRPSPGLGGEQSRAGRAQGQGETATTEKDGPGPRRTRCLRVGRSGAFRGGRGRGGRASERWKSAKSQSAMDWGGVRVTGAAAEQSQP